MYKTMKCNYGNPTWSRWNRPKWNLGFGHDITLVILDHDFHQLNCNFRVGSYVIL